MSQNRQSTTYNWKGYKTFFVTFREYEEAHNHIFPNVYNKGTKKIGQANASADFMCGACFVWGYAPNLSAKKEASASSLLLG